MQSLNMHSLLETELFNHIVVAKNMHTLFSDIIKVYEMLKLCLCNNKVLICGNGGSAADAQHFAAELTGRYKVNRRALPALALTTDTSALTAIGNDYGYEYIFSRQVEALAHREDLLFCISTSGNSKNIILAAQKSKEIGCKCIHLGGRDGGEMLKLADINLIIPSQDTPRIQEMHIFIIHCLCDMIEKSLKEL